MVLPVPVDYLREEERYRKMKAAEEIAKTTLAKEISGPVITRTANPADFGLSGNTFEWSLGGTGSDTLVDKVLDDDVAYAIYGFTNLSTDPKITRIIIKSGAETVADINFEDIYGHDTPEILLDKPIVFSPKSRMIIEAVNTASSSTTEKLVIKAVVAEKAGKTVAKPY